VAQGVSIESLEEKANVESDIDDGHRLGATHIAKAYCVQAYDVQADNNFPYCFGTCNLF
jgi:hypothetical protein